MWTPTRPETYQDLKGNLVAATVVLLIGYSVLSAYAILPYSQVEEFRSFLRGGSKSDLVGGGLFLAVLIAVAVVFVYLLEIHDIYYDRLFVKWRKYYDVDVIIRSLCAPYSNRLPERFFTEAERNRRDFMYRLFYFFVRDGAGIITTNAVVRFYERAWKYWITQVNEILLTLLFIISALYSLWLSPHSVAPFVPYLLFLLYLLNRGLIKIWLPPVREATLEEITEIKDNHAEQLEGQIKAVCQAYSIPYGQQTSHSA